MRYNPLTGMLETIGALLNVANVFTQPQSVPDDPYDATAWNGSVEVPTKNAIRDKIESMSSGSGLTHPQIMSRVSLGF